ncbi:MAG: UvrB/UvrC motif-containing protein [Planctomycetes bacterium]|nr:UvrB/UvrC motif-containing protein [Planctomycetota bacterium]MCB9910843.1 UvrB/UvrC motif-containing protein [Planctomycetota bacterium]MCB9912225.1 UvrB/UvrC motif-containing protein [Planctomycetota bacterium]HPF15409.1 UvrB/UvrC motif-containing protein [Planctomycetota bacterium]HRV80867.1 UvrB/UvrC motif-containing protein [Planctomycetota bacterium]
MKCQFCQVNQSNVHVTEVEQWDGFGGPKNKILIKHLCEACAQRQDLPFAGAGAKASAKLWQLMNLTAKVEIKTSVLACPHCGTTQLELRKKGRVGCPKCYEVFSQDLETMLERIHGATSHVGRVPGIANSYERDRMEQINQLKARLDQAIHKEEFEAAAGLRDQLAELEQRKEA